MTDPRTVKLPVCESCGLVGKRTRLEGVETNRHVSYCYGPAGDNHRKTRMKYVQFREVKEAK